MTATQEEAKSTTVIRSTFQRRAEEPREISSRVVSSRVVEETVLGEIPPDYESENKIKVVEEQIRRVAPFSSVHEQSKTVTKPTVLPKTPPFLPVSPPKKRHPRKTKVIEVPREVIREVRVPGEYRQIEKHVKVPGEVIEKVKTIPIERAIEKIRFEDQEIPVVVAQSYTPKIVDTSAIARKIVVEMRQLNPVLVPIDIFVPVPVVRNAKVVGRVDFHRNVTLPAAHYNGLVKQLNPELAFSEEECCQDAFKEMLKKDQFNAFPILEDATFVRPINYNPVDSPYPTNTTTTNTNNHATTNTVVLSTGNVGTTSPMVGDWGDAESGWVGECVSGNASFGGFAGLAAQGTEGSPTGETILLPSEEAKSPPPLEEESAIPREGSKPQGSTVLLPHEESISSDSDVEAVEPGDRPPTVVRSDSQTSLNY